MSAPDPVFIFQNSHLVVVDKPHGVLSVPPRFKDERRVLGLELESFLARQIWPVHRLDYEVSGLIIYALSSDAHKLLGRAFENTEIRKTYSALTSAVPTVTEWVKHEATTGPELQTWKSRIERGKKRSYASPRGQDALTEARCLGQVAVNGKAYLQWELNPLTGRPHQLRFELSSRGYPIVGDKLYSSDEVWLGTEAIASAIALRAVRLQFPEALRGKLELPAEIEVPGLF